MATVHIIGSGVSGLAAATQLAAAHVPVKLYEASSHAGGRARSSNDATLGTIDHGLHIIGAHARETLIYLKRIGAQDSLAPINHPTPLAAAPLADYLALLPLLWKREGTLGELLHPHNHLRDAWAAKFAHLFLHTPLDKLSIKATRRAVLCMTRRPQPYMVKHSLAESFITPALTHLDYHGGSVYFSHALTGIDRDGDTLRTLTFTRKKITCAADDILILATPTAVTQSLVPMVSATTTHAAITIHYTIVHREADDVHAPINAPVDLIRFTPGRISVSIRVADNQGHSDTTLLAERIWRWLRNTYPRLKSFTMPAHAIWREKCAGHSLTIDRTIRLGDLPPRILLAGDWLDVNAPASLESAIASGHSAATAAIALMPSCNLRHQ